MNPHTAPFAFIVGHYKAGSTWLLNMLCLHPQVRGVRETHIFHHVHHGADARSCTDTLFNEVPFAQGGLRKHAEHQAVQAFAPLLKRWRPALAIARQDRPAGLLDLTRTQVRTLRKALLANPLGATYLQTFFTELWRAFGEPRYLLEKTPQNIGYLDDVRAAFPAAKLIAVYRDGRDVVVSARAFKDQFQGAGGRTFDHDVTLWRDAMRTHVEAVASGDLTGVAYEDLQRDPHGTLVRVLEELQLPADETLIERMVARSSFEFRTGRQRGEEAKGRFDRKGVAGDWVNHFTDEDKARFKAIAGDLLVTLGYEEDDDW